MKLRDHVGSNSSGDAGKRNRRSGTNTLPHILAGTMTLREYVPEVGSFGEEFTNFVAGRHYLWNSKMDIPVVRDHHGVLIRPGPDYLSRFRDQTPVSFDVMLRL